VTCRLALPRPSGVTVAPSLSLQRAPAQANTDTLSRAARSRRGTGPTRPPQRPDPTASLPYPAQPPRSPRLRCRCARHARAHEPYLPLPSSFSVLPPARPSHFFTPPLPPAAQRHPAPPFVASLVAWSWTELQGRLSGGAARELDSQHHGDGVAVSSEGSPGRWPRCSADPLSNCLILVAHT
jgi:hypothetical protein